jgi:hypothetical protein
MALESIVIGYSFVIEMLLDELKVVVATEDEDSLSGRAKDLREIFVGKEDAG